ncbi:succinylglutamate desuccinylase/aspartoacylase family protein [Massilia sp. TS11]|uniref:succinylglutamate desuccinylase/aspartoacylase domain-containing protein n=1 Tax=Massilia sp. TS11 TaxID=2908003 RepID=UPI001EDAFDBC|nr:succinylglutamate desuccinylase/aspartoacylase family protein [Massilia sp. TS11]MCG2584494.1 succinylglutamate desuccinylase/aspartoacylase family protein [Massilia sp. TS11]
MQFKSVQYTGLGQGPRLIITGAVHGNETAGTKAIERVLAELERGDYEIVAGTVTFVPVTNPLAYAKGERAGDRNLNRNLCPTDDPQEFEDHVANWLCPLLARHEVLLDLHSFNAQAEPFVMVGPRNNAGPLQPFRHAEQERAMARILGVKRYVDGWLATYGAGVERRMQTRDPSERDKVVRYGIGTTEYMRSTGGYALTLECGQHLDPQAPDVGYRAIKNVLAHFGMIDAPRPQPMPLAEMETLSMVVVHDKASEGDRFIKTWSSFDPVKVGDQIGVRADGTPVLAELEGRILFPDVNAKPGHEWYYLAQPHQDFERYAD